MVARRARFRVGTQRIAAGLTPWQSGYTRAIRNQMKSVEESYTRLIEVLQADTPKAIKQMLRPVYNRSQELVPVDTGALKSSGYLEVVKRRGQYAGEVGYGRGGNPPYAVLVHEDLDVPHVPPTQAKFLEQAADEHINDMLDQAGHVYSKTLGM